MRDGSIGFEVCRKNIFSFTFISPLVCFLFPLFLQCAPLYTPVAMDATPENILEAINRNAEQLHDLEGKVNVRVYASDVEETAVAKILFRKPDWLRVEVKGPLGVTVANVQMMADTIRVYYPLSNVLIQGRPTAENFEIMTGIQLDVADLQSFLLGEGGLTRGALEHLVEFEVDKREYRLSFVWDVKMQTYWVDPKLHLVTKSELYDEQGILEMRQTYKNYERFRDLRLPTKIEIERENGYERVQFILKEGIVNRGISDDRFRMNVPTDVERIELSN